MLEYRETNRQTETLMAISGSCAEAGATLEDD